MLPETFKALIKNFIYKCGSHKMKTSKKHNQKKKKKKSSIYEDFMTSTKASFRDLCVSIVLLLQFVIFIYEKSRGIAFY